MPLPANARFLQRPQGAQRRLLCLSKTPDARDIEALVGAIPPQRLELLATLEVPEPDDPVIAATGESAAIGVHLERMHRPLMRLSYPHAVPAVNLPPAQSAVTASTDKPFPTRDPGHRKGHSGMPRQGLHPLPAVRLPHEEFPTLSATTSRGQSPPIGAPGHVHDDPAVSRQSSQQRATRS